MRNKPFSLAIGVTSNGERDIIGIWAGADGGGEGAKFWLGVLTEIKNRGVEDAGIVVCDGLKGLPDAITTVWIEATVQTCVIHLIRNTFRYAARQHWEAIARDLFPNDQAAIKCLYLVTRALDPTGKGRARWITRWKPALNAFALAFENRIH